MKKHRIAHDVREQIIIRIKNDGLSVADAATEHELSEQTIYNWLGKKADGTPSVLEFAKLKRERDELLRLVGEITLKLSGTQKKEVMDDSFLSKSARARALRVARSTLYYTKKKTAEDWGPKCASEEVLREFPSYGFRRVAQHLCLNKKRVQRVMRLFGIKAYRRRGRRWKKPKVQAVEYPNLLMTVSPSFPHHAWVADFTYLSFHGRFVYVATVMDVYTRDNVGVSVMTTHAAVLTISALWSALLKHPRPLLFHSDNGREYDARSFRDILTSCNIQISRSRKGCPWENGYQESFYDKFKVELGDPNRFAILGELVAEIYRTVHVYNTLRIHTALKMPPRAFAQLHAPATMQTIV